MAATHLRLVAIIVLKRIFFISLLNKISYIFYGSFILINLKYSLSAVEMW